MLDGKMVKHNNLFSFAQYNSKLAAKWWFYFRRTVIYKGTQKVQILVVGRGWKIYILWKFSLIIAYIFKIA